MRKNDNNELLTKVKSLYQKAILELEGYGSGGGPFAGMKMLRHIIDLRPLPEAEEDKLNFWQAAACYKLGQIYYDGIPNLLPQDRLHAYCYFTESCARGNEHSLFYMAKLYGDMGDHRHEWMCYKDIAEKRIDNYKYALSQLAQLKSLGYNLKASEDWEVPEFDY